MTTLTDTQVITASGGLVELGVATSGSQITVAAGANTSLATSTAITGPVTAVCDGSPVIVEFFAPFVQPSGSASGNYIGFSVYTDGVFSGFLGTVMTPSASGLQVPVRLVWRSVPSAGSHTFEVRAARDSSGSGSAIINGTTAGGWASTMTRVSKIVQATQWPAVTTGTIICTSSTRPASPFEGQRIYQTDDKRELVYNGSAWVTTTPVGASTPDSGTRGSTSYGALTGGGTNPSVTVQTGTSALVTLGSWCQVGSNVAAYVSFKVSGATTRASSDNDMIALYQFNTSNVEAAVSRTVLVTGLTAGINTFELEYRGNVSSTLTYQRRSIVVQGIP